MKLSKMSIMLISLMILVYSIYLIIVCKFDLAKDSRELKENILLHHGFNSQEIHVLLDY